MPHLDDGSRAAAGRATAWSRAFLGLAGAAGILGLACVVLGLRNGTHLNHVAAAWTAMAADLAQGLFYRPLYAPDIGYGGTRFFPLFFSLQALGIRAGLAPVVAGQVVALLSGALLLGGAYVTLRRLAVARPVAAGMTALLLASVVVQHGLATTRGDVLPLALDLWAFAVCLGAPGGRRRLAACALLFSLAFAAKPTALGGALALGLWLLAQGRRRDAALFAGLVTAGCGLVVGVTEAASGGRFLAILQACASGGASVRSALAAPRLLSGMFLWKDPWGFCLVAAACVACLARLRSSALTLPGLYLAASLGAAVVVFGSPGVTWNHLADPVAAAVLFLGAAAGASSPAPRRMPLAPRRMLPTGLLLLAAGAALPGIATLRQEAAAAGAGAAQERQAVIAALPAGPGAILAEDPLVPLLAGERPYVLDPFMLRLVAGRDAGFAAPLVERIADRSFRAVVFLNDPRTHGPWYETVHFGPQVMRAIEANYEPAGQAGRYVVYAPRRDLPTPGGR